MTMFHMTNDSHLFWTRERLEKHGAYPVDLGRWKKGAEEWVPLYEGKMVQAFDHRAADVVVNSENVHRPAQPEAITDDDHAITDRFATPQYFVESKVAQTFGVKNWAVGFQGITAPTNERGMIAAIVPAAGYGNTLPVLLPSDPARQAEGLEWLTCFNSFVFDYVARSKIQGQHLNWFIVEQLPVLPPAAYDRAFGPKTAAEIVQRPRPAPQLHRPRHAAVRARHGLRRRAVHMERGRTAALAGAARRALFPSLRDRGGGRHPLHPLDVPDRRAQGPRRASTACI